MAVDWEQLFREAENGPQKPFIGTADITIAEELAFGFFFSPAEIVAIKDTEGRTWIINETHEDDGELRGLVSRYHVRPGMRLRLRVSSEKTRVFCITPEYEDRPQDDPRLAARPIRS